MLLGAVDAEEKDLAAAIAMFRKAIEIDPELEEPHYRLAQAYELSGQAAKAQEERELYKKLSAEAADRCRA